MRLLPCGNSAILIEFEDRGTRRQLAAALSRCTWTDVVDVVPADRTVLVRATPGSSLPDLAQRIRSLAIESAGTPGTVGDAGATGTAARVHQVPVRYDGPDLSFVADHVGITVSDVITRHTEQDWSVEFAGFTPGFAYLSGSTGDLLVPRRASPRILVPAGAVALAGDYAGIYPSDSPGGWQIIGHTTVRPWDLERPEPALFAPGDVVRFVIAEP